jgi:hypothetical protein
MVSEENQPKPKLEYASRQIDTVPAGLLDVLFGTFLILLSGLFALLSLTGALGAIGSLFSNAVNHFVTAALCTVSMICLGIGSVAAFNGGVRKFKPKRRNAQLLKANNAFKP